MFSRIIVEVSGPPYGSFGSGVAAISFRYDAVAINTPLPEKQPCPQGCIRGVQRIPLFPRGVLWGQSIALN